jgi:hypothetical protein
VVHNRYILFITIWFLAGNKGSCQINPTNLTWNGCTYHYNSLLTGDTIKCNETFYKLVFKDDFDGVALDPSKWQSPWARSLHSIFTGTGWERQYYKDDNVSVQNGTLRIFTQIDPGVHAPIPFGDSVFFKYSSGMVNSVPEFTKGKFEARCKIPKITGMFPAFWLYGSCAQEIDIFEFTNADKSSDQSKDGAHQIATYHMLYDCADTSHGQCNSGFTRDYKIDLSDDFHVYSVEWNENKIIWKMDGEITREVYRIWEIGEPNHNGLLGYASPVKNCNQLKTNSSYSEFFPFPSPDNRMRVIFNNAVLLDRASDPGALPQEFLVDYIKVYEEIDGAEAVAKSDGYDLVVYPNPSENFFKFTRRIMGKAIERMRILNSTGLEVFPIINIEQQEYSVDFVTQPKGLYVLQLYSNDKIYIRKLLYR